MLFAPRQSRARELELKAERAVEKHHNQWMATDGVVGVGIGRRKPRDPASVVIKIYVRSLKLPSLRSLPKSVDGIPILLVESGDIRSMERR